MQVTLAQTSHWGPALTVLNEQLILGWTGEENNYLNLISSSDGGQSWGASTTISSQTSAAAPALAALGNVLYIAWAGTDSKNYLNLMQTSDLKSFPVQITFAEPTYSGSGPALAVFKNALYIAWAGSDGSLNVAQVADNALAIKVTFAINGAMDDPQSYASPALAADDDYLYVAWTGTLPSDESIGTDALHLVTFGAAGNSAPYMYLMRSADGSNFSGPVNTQETSSTGNGPALTVSGGNLVIGWAGSGENGYLSTMYSTDQGQTFTGKEIDKSNASDRSPALSGEMVAWRGADAYLNLKQGV